MIATNYSVISGFLQLLSINTQLLQNFSVFWCFFSFHSLVYCSVIFIILQHPFPQAKFSNILQEFADFLRCISFLIML